MKPFSINQRGAGGISVVAGAAVVVALLSFTVSPAAMAASGEMSADAKALAKLDDDWSKAAGTRDAERVASYYAEDAIAYPPNEPAALGRAAAKKVWGAYFAEPSLMISWRTQHAEVIGDLGYTSGSYEVTSKGPDGKAGSEKGKYLCVWKKQADGTWKAVHDMWNSDAK